MRDTSYLDHSFVRLQPQSGRSAHGLCWCCPPSWQGVGIHSELRVRLSAKTFCFWLSDAASLGPNNFAAGPERAVLDWLKKTMLTEAQSKFQPRYLPSGSGLRIQSASRLSFIDVVANGRILHWRHGTTLHMVRQWISHRRLQIRQPWLPWLAQPPKHLTCTKQAVLTVLSACMLVKLKLSKPRKCQQQHKKLC